MSRLCVRIVLVGIIGAALTGTAASQPNPDHSEGGSPPAKLRVGVKAGLNMSMIVHGSEVELSNARGGFAVGGFASYELSSHFAVQQELHYTSKGAEFYSRASGRRTIRAQYLEAPLLVRATFPTQTERKLYAIVGASASLFIHGSVHDDVATVATMPELNRFELAVIAGTSIHIGGENDSGELILEVRYIHGITDVYRVAGSTTPTRNRTATFMLGYMF